MQVICGQSQLLWFINAQVHHAQRTLFSLRTSQPSHPYRLPFSDGPWAFGMWMILMPHWWLLVFLFQQPYNSLFSLRVWQRNRAERDADHWEIWIWTPVFMYLLILWFWACQPLWGLISSYESYFACLWRSSKRSCEHTRLSLGD